MTAPNPFDQFDTVPAATSSANPFDQFDAPPDAHPESDSAPPETVGRVAGSYARGLAGGIGGLPETVGNAAKAVFNPLSSLQAPIEHALGVPKAPETPAAPEEPYSPQLADFVHPERWQKAAEYFAQKGGLPHPSTPAER